MKEDEFLSRLSPDMHTLGKEIQVALIKKSCLPDDDLGAHSMEWIAKNTEAFRTVFDQLTAEHPAFVTEWRERPDTILRIIEARLPQEEED